MKVKLSQVLASQQVVPKEQNFNQENIQVQNQNQHRSHQDQTSNKAKTPLQSQRLAQQAKARRKTSLLQKHKKLQEDLPDKQKLPSLPTLNKSLNSNKQKKEDNNFMQQSITSIISDDIQKENEVLQQNNKRKQFSLKKMSSKVIEKQNSIKVEERHGYHPIDMQMAINFVATKGKMFKEKIINEEIDENFVHKHIITSSSFRIKYHSLLQRLCNEKKMNAEFKNVQKKEFFKLEQFFIKQLDLQLKYQNLGQKIKSQTKSLQKTINQKINDIQEQIKYEENCTWDL